MGSGKSFCVRFLHNLRYFCTEQRFKAGILRCFIERTSVPTGEFDVLNLNIRFHEGVPVDFKRPRGEPCLFIFDDLNDDYSSGLVCDLFTKCYIRGVLEKYPTVFFYANT